MVLSSSLHIVIFFRRTNMFEKGPIKLKLVKFQSIKKVMMKFGGSNVKSDKLHVH